MNLSQADMSRWDSAVRDLPTRPGELPRWVQGPLKQFFRCAAVFIAQAEVCEGQFRIRRTLAHGYSPECQAQLETTFTPHHRGSLARWLEHGTPVLVDADYPPAYASEFELAEIRQYHLRCTAAHGVVNFNNTTVTWCSFARIEDPCPWHLSALGLIAPVVEELMRMDTVWPDGSVQARLQQLTQVQRVVAREVGAGYSLKEISDLLRMPPDKVKAVMLEVYGLLGVKGRAELMKLMQTY